ncbi:hypothetical protein M1D89_20325 [Arthrobacter sp. D3-18]
MTAPHIDDTTHGSVRWFHGKGPVPVQPYVGDCQHWGLTVIAWGWDLKHYELNTCDLTANGQPGCGSRAWMNERGISTTQWMQPIIEANRQAIAEEIANPLTFNKGGKP